MANCPICNQRIDILAKVKVKDGVICPPCSLICNTHQSKTIAELRDYWFTNHLRVNWFNPTDKIPYNNLDKLNIDYTNKAFAFGNLKKSKREPIIYLFNEVDYYTTETLGKQNSVTKKKGGISRAIIGGAIAGPVGAIVGNNTAKAVTTTKGGICLLKLHISTYIESKTIYIHSPSPVFIQLLDNCIAAKNHNDNKVIQTLPMTNVADEIIKFKELLDKNIITQEEFDLKKKELLRM